jgi:hypothetical protein
LGRYFFLKKTNKNQKNQNQNKTNNTNPPIHHPNKNQLTNHASFRYKRGMQPVVFSTRDARHGWHRAGSDIGYARTVPTLAAAPAGLSSAATSVASSSTSSSSLASGSNNTATNASVPPLPVQQTASAAAAAALLRRSKKPNGGTLYTLSFSYTCTADGDSVYFAHSFPYTYTDLQAYLAHALSNPAVGAFAKRTTLAKTLADNSVDLVTITARGDASDRRGVIISARVHPGEANASWMMKVRWCLRAFWCKIFYFTN